MIRAAGVADILAVLQDLSDISKQEFETLKITPWQALKDYSDCLRAGSAVTFLDRGEPLFVLGHHPDPLKPELRSLWFVGAQRYFAMGGRGVRLGQRVVRHLQRAYPGVEFESMSWSGHPRTPRWFTLLGFEYASRGPGFACYRLPVESRVGHRATT
jgi:hypothetical protein